jgi:hypothetical protein
MKSPSGIGYRGPVAILNDRGGVLHCRLDKNDMWRLNLCIDNENTNPSISGNPRLSGLVEWKHLCSSEVLEVRLGKALDAYPSCLWRSSPPILHHSCILHEKYVYLGWQL